MQCPTVGPPMARSRTAGAVVRVAHSRGLATRSIRMVVCGSISGTLAAGCQAQQESRETSVVKALAAIRMPSAMVR